MFDLISDTFFRDEPDLLDGSPLCELRRDQFASPPGWTRFILTQGSEVHVIHVIRHSVRFTRVVFEELVHGAVSAMGSLYQHLVKMILGESSFRDCWESSS